MQSIPPNTGQLCACCLRRSVFSLWAGCYHAAARCAQRQPPVSALPPRLAPIGALPPPLVALVWHCIWRGNWLPLEDNFDTLIWLGFLLAIFVMYVQRAVGPSAGWTGSSCHWSSSCWRRRPSSREDQARYLSPRQPPGSGRASAQCVRRAALAFAIAGALSMAGCINLLAATWSPAAINQSRPPLPAWEVWNGWSASIRLPSVSASHCLPSAGSPAASGVSSSPVRPPSLGPHWISPAPR